MQRRLSKSSFGIDIRAILNQPLRYFETTSLNSEMQRRRCMQRFRAIRREARLLGGFDAMLEKALDRAKTRNEASLKSTSWRGAPTCLNMERAVKCSSAAIATLREVMRSGDLRELEAASADWDQVLDVLVTADALHCDALKARCMQTLVDRYGAVARGGDSDDPPTELEMVSDDLTCRFPDLTDGPYGDVKFGDLPGVERLQGRLRAEVEEALGVEASTSTVFRWRRVVELLRDEVLEVPASRDPERFD